MMKFILCPIASAFDIPCSIFDILFLSQARLQPIADIGKTVIMLLAGGTPIMAHSFRKNETLGPKDQPFQGAK
jgi:hypothetical protein